MIVRAASEFLALEADYEAWEDHRAKLTDERSYLLRAVVRDSPARSWRGLYAKAQMIMLFEDCLDTQEAEMMASLFADITRMLEEEKAKG